MESSRQSDLLSRTSEHLSLLYDLEKLGFSPFFSHCFAIHINQHISAWAQRFPFDVCFYSTQHDGPPVPIWAPEIIRIDKGKVSYQCKLNRYSIRI